MYTVLWLEILKTAVREVELNGVMTVLVIKDGNMWPDSIYKQWALMVAG
jgi:hypothetical protein